MCVVEIRYWINLLLEINIEVTFKLSWDLQVSRKDRNYTWKCLKNLPQRKPSHHCPLVSPPEHISVFGWGLNEAVGLHFILNEKYVTLNMKLTLGRVSCPILKRQQEFRPAEGPAGPDCMRHGSPLLLWFMEGSEMKNHLPSLNG